MKGFCQQATYKEQGQRRVNLPTIMTIGEMLEYWRKARREVITELDASDLHAGEGARHCGGAEKGCKGRRKSRV